jgi:hypothetical protein
VIGKWDVFERFTEQARRVMARGNSAEGRDRGEQPDVDPSARSDQSEVGSDPDAAALPAAADGAEPADRAA